MDRPKKVLILYASAGHGHEKAARAVAEALALQGAQTQLLDTLTLVPAFFGKNYRSGYLYMIQHMPKLWGFFYYLLDIRLIYWLILPFRWLNNRLVGGWIERRISQDKPDAVVSTHFMATEMVGHLKAKGRLAAPLVTVVTDYLAHEFWLAPQVDCYAAASERTLSDLKRRGVPQDKIAVTGIPIERKFSEAPAKAAARAALGLEAESFTVLVTSGGAGVGAMEPLAEAILEACAGAQVLAVCGTNGDLEARMKQVASKYPGLRVFGFVDNIQELMSASDLVVGKGGGLTVSESLAIGRPLLLFGSVPGQETRNAACMKKAKAARIARSIPEAAAIAAEFRLSPAALEQSTRSAASLGRAKAADEVARLVLFHAL